MEQQFEAVYRYLRLLHYSKLFEAINERPGSLSATEAFSAEVIYLLGEPTIREFADFLGISQPNASYKVLALVSKGYLTKEPCETDRRELKLMVTQKFLDYYGNQLPDISAMLEDLSAQELAVLEKLCEKATTGISSILGKYSAGQ